MHIEKKEPIILITLYYNCRSLKWRRIGNSEADCHTTQQCQLKRKNPSLNKFFFFHYIFPKTANWYIKSHIITRQLQVLAVTLFLFFIYFIKILYRGTTFGNGHVSSVDKNPPALLGGGEEGSCADHGFDFV